MGRSAAPLRPAGDVRHLGWAPVDDEHLKVLGVGADATDDELNRAFRLAARAAHPDTGGDAAQFDRVQRAYDQTRRSRGLKAPSEEGNRSPHDLAPVRPASRGRRAWRRLRRTTLTRDHAWFAAMCMLFAALAVATSASFLQVTVGVMVVGALTSGRLEWNAVVAQLGYLLFVLGGLQGLVDLVWHADTSGLDPAGGLALRSATVGTFVVLLVVSLRWMTEQRRGAPWRMYLRLERSLARQWYAAVARASEGEHSVWFVLRVHPHSGCTRCELVELGTGRRRDVLLAGWPPLGTYLVLDSDGSQQAWAPQGSCLAARFVHPDYADG